MSVITKNLPWFVKDLGVSIVGEKCYTTLVEDLRLSDVPCLKYALSKGLGVGIVLGGGVMKVPQILLILNASSARGLSLPSYILETLSYGITLAYSVRNAFPFSTYGENAFLLVQNIAITFLIILFSPVKRARGGKDTKGQQVLGTTVATIATAFVLQHVDMEKLALLQVATLPLSLFSKLPQIQQNWRSRSTGQLSAFAVVSQVLGCLARVFTTTQEVGDPLVLAGFVLALVLNIILGVQLYLYWGQGVVEKQRVDVGKELRELGNGSGRRGGAAVASSTGVSPSDRHGEEDTRGGGASVGLSDLSSPSSTSTSCAAPSSSLSPSSASTTTISPSPRTPSASERSERSEKVGAYEGLQASPARVGTPPARSGTPSGRKWSRKVD